MTASSMPLFGARRPTLTQRAPARVGGAASAAATRPPAGTMAAGGTTAVRRVPRLAQLRLVEGRHGDAERAAGRQLAQLRLGQQLVARQARCPRRRRARAASRCGSSRRAARGAPAATAPAPTRWRTGRPARPRARPRRRRRRRPRLGLGLGVRPLDVDLRPDATGRQDVAQAQRVPPDRVAAVQHRDELVDAAHAERALPSSQRGQQADEAVGGRLEVELGQSPAPRFAQGRHAAARRPGGPRWRPPARRGPCPRRGRRPRPAPRAPPPGRRRRRAARRSSPPPPGRRSPRARRSRRARRRWHRPTPRWRRSRARRT